MFSLQLPRLLLLVMKCNRVMARGATSGCLAGKLPANPPSPGHSEPHLERIVSNITSVSGGQLPSCSHASWIFFKV